MILRWIFGIKSGGCGQADEIEAALSGNREEHFSSGELEVFPHNAFNSAQVLPVCVSHC
jgi:hypothetical protein